MTNHECRYMHQDTILCLDCDQPAEIVYQCPHGVQKHKKVKCNCDIGKHRKKETPEKRGWFRKKS